MSTRTPLLASAAVLALAACGPPDTSAEDEAAIQATAARWQELDRAEDAAGIAALFAEDGELVWEDRLPGGPDLGQEELARHFAEVDATVGTFAPDRVLVGGDLAVEEGTYRSPGDVGRYVTVHRKVGELLEALDQLQGVHGC